MVAQIHQVLYTNNVMMINKILRNSRMTLFNKCFKDKQHPLIITFQNSMTTPTPSPILIEILIFHHFLKREWKFSHENNCIMTAFLTVAMSNKNTNANPVNIWNRKWVINPDIISILNFISSEQPWWRPGLVFSLLIP